MNLDIFTNHKSNTLLRDFVVTLNKSHHCMILYKW